MAAQVYNPNYLRGADRTITVCGWPWQKCKILSENKLKKQEGLGAWLK
jgi:hypothetical protein